MSEKQNILIFGHYGGSNTGDEAMLWSLLDRTDEREDVEVRVLTKSPENAIGPASVVFKPWSFFAALKGTIWAKTVILGGGTHFHDDYATLRYLRHFIYMSRIVALAVFARLLGRKFLMIGMGFGPFRGISSNLLTKLVLRLANWISVRDEFSYRTIKGWVRPAKLHRAFDLAGLLPVRDNPGLSDPCLGISVAFSESFEMEGMSSAQWWDEFAAGLGNILAREKDWRVRIFVFRGGERESDEGVSKRMQETLIAAIGEERVELVPYQPDPCRTLEGIAGCSAFIATRYHSALMSYIVGCRMIYLCYHQKLEALANDIGLDKDAVIDFRYSEGREKAWLQIGRLIEDGSTFQAELPVEDAVKRAENNFGWLSSSGKAGGSG